MNSSEVRGDATMQPLLKWREHCTMRVDDLPVMKWLTDKLWCILKLACKTSQIVPFQRGHEFWASTVGLSGRCRGSVVCLFICGSHNLPVFFKPAPQRGFGSNQAKDRVPWKLYQKCDAGQWIKKELADGTSRTKHWKEVNLPAGTFLWFKNNASNLSMEWTGTVQATFF